MDTTFFHKRGRGFTLVEIMMAVATTAVLGTIAVPGVLRARKDSQASRIMTDLRLIEGAVDQHAIENSKSGGTPVTVVEWTKTFQAQTSLYLMGKDILGSAYGDMSADLIPSVATFSKSALSDVVDNSYWSPYN